MTFKLVADTLILLKKIAAISAITNPSSVLLGKRSVQDDVAVQNVLREVVNNFTPYSGMPSFAVLVNYTNFKVELPPSP